MTDRVRLRARVRGTVQGVGFRPFVYRLAAEERLDGWVLNDEHGVLLEVEGDPAAVARLVTRVTEEAPPLAVVDALEREPVPVQGRPGFAIRHSEGDGSPDALVTPDSATCSDCLAELTDPGDRRHRYPFINCTNCGPRFTIVRGVPYDRPLTTMAAFAMCPDCRREYEDPGDRRFHAQPNACPACGPRVSLLDHAGRPALPDGARDPIAAAADRLAAGAILAVKGLGGYHLVCDAANAEAVSALRSRKQREDKPFALMVGSVDAALELVELDAAAIEALQSPARPIVLCRRRVAAPVAAAVAPGAPELGVMLPYTPLHHLLLDDVGDRPLVMTSGNRSDEPIAFRDTDALSRLAEIADWFLVHDREIETRTDDSVVRLVATGGARRQALTLRRSRGYVPAPFALPVPAGRPLLACGAEQKNTFCVVRGARAWVGHHIGDLEDFSTLEAFRHGIDHFERMFAVTPELLVCDLHPDYLSTKYAFEREASDDLEALGVQHHHAHLAAVLADHGRTAPAVGAIYDGTGFGPDGTVWGGELLAGDLRGYERAGHLSPVRMPGGAAAVRQPWRMACAWLTEAHEGPVGPTPALRAGLPRSRWEAIQSVGATPAVSPVTTSMGRLFDAVGAMCGLAPEVSYEGQAAIELEAAASASSAPCAYTIELARPGAALVLDPRAMVRAIAADLAAGVPIEEVAAGFHAAVAEATVSALLELAAARGLETVVVGGGVFGNRILLEAVVAGLGGTGVELLVARRLPPGDGGISFGQAAVAAAREAC